MTGQRVEILYATRKTTSPDARWELEPLEGINTSYHEGDACLTLDERTIYFVSDRPGGKGRRDIWWSKRTALGAPWSEPRPLEGGVNTPETEGWPCLSPDGEVLFFPRFSGEILWAEREDGKERFGPARLLGPPVNSETGLWEGHFRVSWDWPKPGALAYFFRGSGAGDTEIYQTVWRPASSRRKPPGDGR